MVVPPASGRMSNDSANCRGGPPRPPIAVSGVGRHGGLPLRGANREDFNRASVLLVEDSRKTGPFLIDNNYTTE
jgi:hypothetical protein